VARMTPIRHPDTHQLLPNILTLATPHGNPLYAFDETIHQFHELLNDQQDGNTLLVSISGGLRDEMIETKACETGLEDSHSVSESIRWILQEVVEGYVPSHLIDCPY